MFTRRSPDEPLFWLDSGAARAARGLEDFCAGAVLPVAADTAGAAALSFDRARALKPVLFFASREPRDLARFADALRGLAPADADLRIIWTDNPDDPPAAWRGAMISLRGDTVAHDAAIALGGLRLIVPAASAVRFDADGIGFARPAALGWAAAAGRKDSASFADARLAFAGPKLGMVTAQAAQLSGAELAGLGLAMPHDLAGKRLEFPIFGGSHGWAASLQIDPLRPLDSPSSRIALPGGEGSIGTGFRCRSALPSGDSIAFTVHGDGAAVFTEGGLALEADYASRMRDVTLICGLLESETLGFDESRWIFRPRAGGGTGLTIEAPSARYSRHPRLRKATVRSWPMPDRLVDYPILPFFEARADAEQCRAVDAALAAAREAYAVAANPPLPPPPPRPLPPVAIEFVDVPPPAHEKPRPLPGWSCPGTLARDHVGSTAVYEEAGGLRIELNGLPQEAVSAIAWPDLGAQPVLVLTPQELHAVELRLLAGGKDMLGERGGALEDACLVIRGHAGAAETGEALARAVAAAPIARVALEGLLQGAPGVALVNVAAPVPAAASGPLAASLRGLGDMRWNLVGTADGAGRPSAVVAAVALPSLRSPAGRSSVVAFERAEAEWKERKWRLGCRLRPIVLLGHAVAAGQAIRLDTAGEVLTVSGSCALDSPVLEKLVFALAEAKPADPAAPPAKPAAPPTGASEGAAKPRPIETLRISLSGQLHFCELPTDILSFGSEGAGLPFTGLSIDLQRFVDGMALTVDDLGLSVDATGVTARRKSLFQGLPIGLPSLVRGEGGKAFDTLGALPVDCDVARGTPGPGWMALRYAFELGALGRAAANAGLAAELLIGWHPRDGDLAVGLILPGTAASGAGFGVSDLARLSFRSVALVASAEGGADAPAAFALKLEDLKLTLLRLKDLPEGRIDMILCGDPPRGRASPGFGWFAAYAQKG